MFSLHLLLYCSFLSLCSNVNNYPYIPFVSLSSRAGIEEASMCLIESDHGSMERNCINIPNALSIPLFPLITRKEGRVDTVIIWPSPDTLAAQQSHKLFIPAAREKVRDIHYTSIPNNTVNFSATFRGFSPSRT